MTKAELIAAVAEGAKVKKAEAEKAINHLIKTISDTLKKKGRLALAGFGTFSVNQRKTGKPIKIPATKVVKFKPGKQLKEKVK
jgi:DNA-binding protein HU-beta